MFVESIVAIRAKHRMGLIRPIPRTTLISVLGVFSSVIIGIISSGAVYGLSTPTLPAGEKLHLFTQTLPKSSLDSLAKSSGVFDDATGHPWTEVGSISSDLVNGNTILNLGDEAELESSFSGGSASFTSAVTVCPAAGSAETLMAFSGTGANELGVVKGEAGVLKFLYNGKETPFPYAPTLNANCVVITLVMTQPPLTEKYNAKLYVNGSGPYIIENIAINFVPDLGKVALQGPGMVSEFVFYPIKYSDASVQEDLVPPMMARAGLTAGELANPAGSSASPVSGANSSAFAGSSSSGTGSNNPSSSSPAGSNNTSGSTNSSGNSSSGSTSASSANNTTNSSSGISSAASNANGSSSNSSGSTNSSSSSSGSTSSNSSSTSSSGTSSSGANSSNGSGTAAAIVCDDNPSNDMPSSNACNNSSTGIWQGRNTGWGGEEAVKEGMDPTVSYTFQTNQVQQGVQYAVQASWDPFVTNCNTATYFIYDGSTGNGTLLGQFTFDQTTNNPTGVIYNGTSFHTLLEPVVFSSGMATIVVTGNTYGANGQVTSTCYQGLIADAIRIAVPGNPPSAQFIANPSAVTAGTNNAGVTFTNQQGGTAPYTYSYDFGNTGNFEISNSSSATATIPASYLQTPNITLPVRGRIIDSAGDYTDYTVNITVGAQGWITTPYLHIPDFGANPTVVSIASGNWSSTATWSTGQVPGPNAIVRIAAGTTVTYDINDSSNYVPLTTVEIVSGGKLTFSTGANTQMFVQTLMVLQGGELDIGTKANPVPVGITANMVWVNQTINTTADPEQYGHGLIALGTVNTYGATKAPYVQLAKEAHAGDTTLTLAAAPTGWQIGDKLQLPDSHQWSEFQLSYPPNFVNGAFPIEWEQVTIASISGQTVTLTAALQYDHPGPHDVNGNVISDPIANAPLLPHAVNITRNVDIHSQTAQGVRGYALFTQNANVDLEYTAFTGMGRVTDGTFANGGNCCGQPFDNTMFDANGNVTHIGTNQQNRNAINFLNLIGPSTPQNNGFTQPGTNPPVGYQFTFNGNVVMCPLTPMPFIWGLNVVNSYYGLIQNNNVVNWNGAGVIVDNASSYNMFNGNFVMRINGVGGRGSSDGGFGGDGFWMGTVNNYLTGNFVSTLITSGTATPVTTTAGFTGVGFTGGGVYGYAYEYYLMGGGNNYIPGGNGTTAGESNMPIGPGVNIAAYQGADPSQPGQSQAIYTSLLPIPLFTNNTAYGTLPIGFSNWWTHYSGEGSDQPATGSGGTVEHFVVWNAYESAYYGYQNNAVSVHDPVWVEDYNQQFNSGNGTGEAAQYQDYYNANGLIDGAYVVNTSLGTPVANGGTPFIIQNSTIINGGIYPGAMWSVGGDARGENNGLPNTVIINNDKFISAGQPITAIGMGWYAPFQWTGGAINATGIPINVLVNNYNGVQGDNFRVEYYQQAANFKVFPSLWQGGQVGGAYETVVGAQDPSGNPLGTINPNNTADNTTWVTNQYLVGIGSNPVAGLLGQFTATVTFNPANQGWNASGVTPIGSSGAFDGMTMNPPFYGVGVPCTGNGC